MSNTRCANQAAERFTRDERARRFWTAYGRSRAHITLLHAFANNPTLAWTPEGLATWYGIRLDVVGRVLRELTAADIVVETAESWPAFRWNQRHEWAEPATRTIGGLITDEWVSVAEPADELHRSTAAV